MREIQGLFTENELKLLSSAGVMRTKKAATEKIGQLLELTKKNIDKTIEASSPRWHASVQWQPPKISRGENYKGLPYQVLDHPRYFRRPDIFSYRVLFWWGRYFCHSLHISGKFLEVNRKRILSNFPLLHGRKVYLGIGSNPWDYELNETNYKRVERIDLDELSERLQTSDHLKISTKWLLEEWVRLPQVTPEILELFMKLLNQDPSKPAITSHP